jgi:hypothetical protein
MQDKLTIPENIIVARFDNESDMIYNYRVNYINNNINNKSMIHLIKNSKILANIKFKKCKYDPKIYNSMKDFL